MAYILICHGDFNLANERVLLPPKLTLRTFVKTGQTLPTPTMAKILENGTLDTSGGTDFGLGTTRSRFYNLRLEPISKRLQQSFEKANKGNHELAFVEGEMAICETPENANCAAGNHKCGGLLEALSRGVVYLGVCMAVSGEQVGDFSKMRDKDPAVIAWQKQWGSLSRAASNLLESQDLTYLAQFRREWKKSKAANADMKQAFLDETIGEAYSIWDKYSHVTTAYEKLSDDAEEALEVFDRITFDNTREIIATSLPFQVLDYGLALKQAVDDEFEEFASVWNDWCEFAAQARVAPDVFDAVGTGRVFLLGRLSDNTTQILAMNDAKREETIDFMTGLLPEEDRGRYIDYLKLLRSSVQLAQNDARPPQDTVQPVVAAFASEEDVQSATEAMDAYLRNVATHVLDNNQPPSVNDPWQPTKRAVVLELPAGTRYLFPAVGIDLESADSSPQDSMYIDGSSWQLYVSKSDGAPLWLKGVGIESDGKLILNEFTTEA
ncbi:hypothetical protein [Streptomyces sp. NPDC126514]|uniref:hypothetical protein n=1 Tax=Streptomyces sp. NPDC126514 TaxID=3155210 RepID=UPI003327E6D0